MCAFLVLTSEVRRDDERNAQAGRRRDGTLCRREQLVGGTALTYPVECPQSKVRIWEVERGPYGQNAVFRRADYLFEAPLDYNMVPEPCVTELPDSRFRLFYEAPDVNDNRRILSATSRLSRLVRKNRRGSVTRDNRIYHQPVRAPSQRPHT